MASKSLLLNGLKASLRVSGRVSRSEFWGFVPFGLSLCVLGVFGAGMLGFTFMGTVLAMLSMAIPLISLWWRRLQDVGIWGAHAVFPWLSLFACFLCITAAYELNSGTIRSFGSVNDKLWGWVFFPHIIFSFMGGKWVAILIALISLITFLFRFTFALSQTFLPSDLKSNKYGPNPNEVTQ